MVCLKKRGFGTDLNVSERSQKDDHTNKSVFVFLEGYREYEDDCMQTFVIYF